MLFAAGVAGLGVYGIWFSATLPSRLPSLVDWQAAAALVARDAAVGDVVALAPPWAERAREFFPERLPLHPDVPLPVLAFPSYRDEELLGVRRVWLVSLPQAPGYSARVAQDLASRSSAVDGPQQLGALQVTRYDLRAPTTPLYYFPDHLPSAVALRGEDLCESDARGGLRCAGAPPVRVSREVREVDFLPRTCVVASPGGDPSHPLTIEFPDVPMGRALRGHIAAAGDAGQGTGSPVRMSVRVDGEDLGEVDEPAGHTGWHPFAFDTTRFAGRSLPVSLRLSFARPAREPTCLAAATLP